MIIHTYTDQRPDDQTETLTAISKIREVWPTVSEKMVEPDDYWSLLLRNWNRGDDLITVEQDVVPSLRKVRELDQCVARVCAFPYRLPAGQWSVFDITPQDKRPPFHEYIPQYYEIGRPHFTNGTSLGFTKIGLGAQSKIPLHEYPVHKYEWWYLDSFISWYLMRAKIMVHVHDEEVKHNRTVELTIRFAT